VIPTTLPPSGAASGDLTGTYPSPLIATAAVNSSKLADNAVTTTKILDGSVTTAKLAAGVLPTTLPPSGIAGGDLSGTYPAPVIADGVVSTSKLADNSISTLKVQDGSITTAKLAAGVLPTTLPPSGTAGGDLSGNYPNPVLNKIQGINLSSTAPLTGQVLKYDGTQWLPSNDNTGAFSLPYSTSLNSASNLLSITNQGNGSAVEGINSSTMANVRGITGIISSISPGSLAAGVRGINNGTGIEGIGVWGSHAGGGYGVYGSSNSGTGVYGNSTSGFGLVAESAAWNAAFFDVTDPANSSDVVYIYNQGLGNGLNVTSEKSNGIQAITNDSASAGLMALNNLGGRAIYGVGFGTEAGIEGYNASTGAGIKATSTGEGGTALVAELQGVTTGNTAVFKVNGGNVARIDNSGKAFFNGGTQLGGADVAELFDVEGEVKTYEPGDVLVISQTSDRKVEKSSTPYSTLVAGVYATKPGVMLTEKNAEKDQLSQMIAMGVIGVIPTKVCLEGGAIKRGDLIVTSSIPGVAMKADPDKVRVGQVIGKALQDYNGGTIGKINVLVSIK
jgi:co-chaperonin GroES (HSP10)